MLSSTGHTVMKCAKGEEIVAINPLLKGGITALQLLVTGVGLFVLFGGGQLLHLPPGVGSIVSISAFSVAGLLEVALLGYMAWQGRPRPENLEEHAPIPNEGLIKELEFANPPAKTNAPAPALDCDITPVYPQQGKRINVPYMQDDGSIKSIPTNITQFSDRGYTSCRPGGREDDPQAWFQFALNEEKVDTIVCIRGTDTDSIPPYLPKDWLKDSNKDKETVQYGTIQASFQKGKKPLIAKSKTNSCSTYIHSIQLKQGDKEKTIKLVSIEGWQEGGIEDGKIYPHTIAAKDLLKIIARLGPEKVALTHCRGGMHRSPVFTICSYIYHQYKTNPKYFSKYSPEMIADGCIAYMQKTRIAPRDDEANDVLHADMQGKELILAFIEECKNEQTKTQPKTTLSKRKHALSKRKKTI